MSDLFNSRLSRIWNNAVSLYQRGNTESDRFPIENDLPLLSEFGMNKMDIFDYAEDWCLHQEPDFMTFLLVHYERWNYFTEEQESVPSIQFLDPSSLPEKTEEAEGIVWLPRIIPKAKAKLRGELPPSVMYGCGGDRLFFQNNQVHPAQFLRITRRFWDNEQAIINWVLDCKSSSRPHS